MQGDGVHGPTVVKPGSEKLTVPSEHSQERRIQRREQRLCFKPLHIVYFTLALGRGGWAREMHFYF